MHIAIFGIGGVGGYIGSKLLLSKNENDTITFISRGKQLEEIKKDGLKLIDEDQEYLVKPDDIIDSKNILEYFDVIIITVKSYDLLDALTSLKNITKKTILLPLLNGVEHDKMIKKVHPEAKVINGCIYILSNLIDIRTVKKYGGVLNLIFGSKDIELKELQHLKKLFDKADIKNKLTNNIELETWKKYMLISAYASMTSYYKEPLGYIANEKIDELKKTLQEIRHIANAKDIPIGEETIKKILARIKTLPYKSKTSMQLDYEKGKKTELEALCGYIVKEGKSLGIQTPQMQKYYNKLKNI